jgi:hypothetical protein
MRLSDGGEHVALSRTKMIPLSFLHCSRQRVDGAEAPTTKFVMRSVPHCFSLATSIKLAAKRLDAAVNVVQGYQNHFKGLQYDLLDAARAELLDALADLSAVMLLPAVQTHLNAANQPSTLRSPTRLPCSVKIPLRSRSAKFKQAQQV